MKTHDQGFEGRDGDVVQLVDGEQDAEVVITGDLADLDEEAGQVRG